MMQVRTPKIRRPSVWPLPRSLATTCGISVDFSSSSYLDVSVQTVPYVRLFYSTHVDRFFTCRVAPFGNLRINAYVPLPVAYRSLSRPSSAPDAKAFSLRPSSLDLVAADSLHSVSALGFASRENYISTPPLLLSKSNVKHLILDFLGSLLNSCPRIMQAPLTEVVLNCSIRYPLRLLT